MHSKLKCDTCDKNFNNPFAMIQHKAKIHDIISDGILKCDYCPALFKVQRCLEKHVKKQHGVGEGKKYTYFDSFILSTYNIFLFISFIYFKGYNKEFEKFAQNETDETNKDESGISLLNDATDDGDQESKGILRFSIFF